VFIITFHRRKRDKEAQNSVPQGKKTLKKDLASIAGIADSFVRNGQLLTQDRTNFEDNVREERRRETELPQLL
jgi:hypothetical protein